MSFPKRADFRQGARPGGFGGHKTSYRFGVRTRIREWPVAMVAKPHRAPISAGHWLGPDTVTPRGRPGARAARAGLADRRDGDIPKRTGNPIASGVPPDPAQRWPSAAEAVAPAASSRRTYSGFRVSSKRTIGKAMLIAATEFPTWSRIGTAMQRTPASLSSISSA